MFRSAPTKASWRKVMLALVAIALIVVVGSIWTSPVWFVALLGVLWAASLGYLWYRFGRMSDAEYEAHYQQKYGTAGA